MPFFFLYPCIDSDIRVRNLILEWQTYVTATVYRSTGTGWQAPVREALPAVPK